MRPFFVNLEIFHANHGENDEHLGLGKGNIPIKEILPLINEKAPDAIWALETNLDDLENSICLLKEEGYI